MANTIRLGTRGSKLALWQAEKVKSLIEEQNKNINCEIKIYKTTGDIIFNKELKDIGGKGLFIKEIEEALLNKEIDIAVHSMKDLPAKIDLRFELASVLKRANPYDVLISESAKKITDLKPNAVVGTSSPRRAESIKKIRPDIKIVPYRGNVPTRLQKLKDAEVDATILAYAGLERLKLFDNKYMQVIKKDQMIPAVGQGAVAIEILAQNTDENLREILSKINDEVTNICTFAERKFLTIFGNVSCHSPIGCFIEYEKKEKLFSLDAFVAIEDTGKFYKIVCQGEDVETLIHGAANKLNEDSKGEIFAKYSGN